MPFGLGQRTAVGIPINAIAHQRVAVVAETVNSWTTAFHIASGVINSLTRRVFSISDRALLIMASGYVLALTLNCCF